ncbi:MAG TPA: NADP-dependent oxidoreductase [Bryobacteraceae bacterium]
MKAVVLHEYGGVDQLRYENAQDPKPGAGEVLVRVISTSVNPVDLKLRTGQYKSYMPLDLPAILGSDVAGEVEEIGEGVTKFQPGDMVMGLVFHSYAQFLTAKADELTKIPDGLKPAEAGVLPLVLETGAQLMELGVQPKSGETVLVTGALGSVGRTALFVAKQHGAKVIAGVRLKQKMDAASLGADQVVALDEESDLKTLPDLDAIADTVGGETIARLVPKLKKQGRLASVLGKPPGTENIDVRPVVAKPDPDRLFELAEDVSDGKLKIPIACRMSLSDIRKAHETAEKGMNGKILLTP